MSIGRTLAVAAALALAAGPGFASALQADTAPPADVAAPAEALPGPTPVAPVTVSAPADAEEVTLYVNVGYFHSDLVIPRSALADAPPMVKAAVARTGEGPWIIIGWGPWWFGRDVKGAPFRAPPLRMAVAAWTLVVPQTHSQLRVAAIAEPGPAPGEGNMTVKPIVISKANLARLLARIDRSFVVKADAPVAENRKGLAEGVSVYRSRELYHIVHQCNHWMGEVLRAGGFNTNYLLDMFPATLVADLNMAGAKGPGKDAGPASAPVTVVAAPAEAPATAIVETPSPPPADTAALAQSPAP